MADVLSVAASVAGLVSLGFQVCSGITTYLDGIECRVQELESARKYEQSLKASIRVIESVSPQLIVHHHKSSAAVTACMKLCKNELSTLESLVAELCIERITGSSMLDRAKASKKRSTYAFDRPKLSQLQVKVGQAIQSLQLALQILGLESSSSLGDRLQKIESTSSEARANILATKAEVTALAHHVSTLRNEGPFIRGAIENIGPSLLSLEQIATQTVQSVEVVREDTHHAAHMLATEMQLIRNEIATFRSQNTIAQRTTTRLLQLVQQDQRRILFSQMVAKPSYLEEISEACFDVGPSTQSLWPAERSRAPVPTTIPTDHESTDSVLPLRFPRRCTCRPRQRLQRKQVIWSGLLFFQDDVYSEKHFPTCQFWRGTRPVERIWGLTHFWLGWVAQKAIEMTFSCKFGAGGASFGPNFTYYPTVNENTAPAFQVIRTIRDAIRGDTQLIPLERFSLADWQCFFERAFRAIVALFREGKASPKDVNSRNQTLIYPIINTGFDLLMLKFHRLDPTLYDQMVLKLLSDLMSLEIPCNVYDTDGRSPIGALTSWFSCWSVEAVEIVFGTAANVPSVAISQENSSLIQEEYAYLFESLRLQRDSRLVAEAYECGQLSQAVLTGDRKQVERLLEKRYPNILEVNCLGQFPLHLSVIQPSILQLLLRVYSPSQLNIPDFSGFTAFHYAVTSSWNSCKAVVGPKRRCRKCHCARQTKILLKADCAVDIGVLPNLGWFRVSRKCRAILIRGLKDRRNRLKQLALRFLSKCDIVAFDLESERVLDSQTPAILRLLEAEKVQIPPALRLIQQQQPTVTTEYPGVSVYHVINAVEDANMFWAHDFRDIDEFNGQFDEVNGEGLPPIAKCRDAEGVLWLINHGANLYRELTPSNGNADRRTLSVRSAHFVYRRLGHALALHGSLQNSAIQSRYPAACALLHPRVLPVDVPDNCNCSCSKQGCTPFLMLVKALRPYYMTRKKWSSIAGVELFLELLEGLSHGFTKDQYKEAVRYFTFTALDLRHTCYHKPGGRSFTCSVTVEMCEDVMHNQDEQADMIELLEEILLDLDASLDAMTEDDEGFNMRAFLTDHWLVRVEKELEVISGHELSEELKKGMEALGVVWDKPEETASDLEDDGRKTLQYWLDAIDEAAQF